MKKITRGVAKPMLKKLRFKRNKHGRYITLPIIQHWLHNDIEDDVIRMAYEEIVEELEHEGEFNLK